MMIEYITKAVERIKKRCDETDPHRLCKAMGIILQYEPMGNFDGACKGFYLMQSRKQVIVINSDLPELIQRIILVHELGHAVLHRKTTGLKAFHEFSLFDETSTMEYEANIFAAEFLMNDEDVLELLNDDMSFFSAASTLNVPMELLDFKFRILKRKGYMVIDPPVVTNSKFLKKDICRGVY